MKKILSIIGSPHKDGNTAKIINSIHNGAMSNGNSCETVFLSDYDLEYCTDCEACRECGVCPLNDDFMEIVEKIKQCDLLILASPMWHHAVTGYMKVFIDRFAACMLDFKVDSGGVVTMTPRLSNMQGMCVLNGCTGDVFMAIHPIDVVFKAMNIEQREPVLITKVGLTERETQENMKEITKRMYDIGKSI